jgi:hypothetical protein
VIEGRGLVAVAPITKDEIVAIKGGHIVDTATLHSLPERLRNSEVQIASGFHLVALEEAEYESVMPFLNHSCEPNVGFAGNTVLEPCATSTLARSLVVAAQSPVHHAETAVRGADQGRISQSDGRVQRSRPGHQVAHIAQLRRQCRHRPPWTGSGASGHDTQRERQPAAGRDDLIGDRSVGDGRQAETVAQQRTCLVSGQRAERH